MKKNVILFLFVFIASVSSIGYSAGVDNKQIGFFSDAYCVDWSYAKALMVKRMLASVGHPVRSLHRAGYATLSLEGLGPGVTYLISHPAKGGEELSAITDDGHARDFERGFYGGVEGARALEAAGVKRIGMRSLRDLLRS